MGKVGRPPTPHSEQASAMVKAMAQWGVPQGDICAALVEAGFVKSMDEKTLRKVYRKELDAGYSLGKAKLRETAFKLAVQEKDRTMLCFLLKTQCGMRETNRVEMTSPDGSMSPTDITVRFIKPDNAE